MTLHCYTTGTTQGDIDTYTSVYIETIEFLEDWKNGYDEEPLPICDKLWIDQMGFETLCNDYLEKLSDLAFCLSYPDDTNHAFKDVITMFKDAFTDLCEIGEYRHEYNFEGFYAHNLENQLKNFLKETETPYEYYEELEEGF